MGGIVISKKRNRMNKEQFTIVMDALVKQHESLESDMRKAQKAFIDEYPIKEGDKCVDGDGKVCWIKRIQFNSVTSKTPDFVVNYAKKDGTRSNRDLHAYSGVAKIEED